MNYEGNITTMMVHLQYYHRSEYLKVKKGKVKRMQPSQMTSLTTSDRQPSITEVFHHMKLLSKASKRWNQSLIIVCLCITYKGYDTHNHHQSLWFLEYVIYI